jgi:hypothetical protein
MPDKALQTKKENSSLEINTAAFSCWALNMDNPCSGEK